VVSLHVSSALLGERDEFLDRIVTGDETWVLFENAETEKHSKTVDAHAFSQQAQDIQTNTVKQNNGGYNILGP
jgi:hypothetical protein